MKDLCVFVRVCITVATPNPLIYLCVCCAAGPVVYVLDLADRLISKACPFAAAGIMVGSIYWTAVTYGAVTVMQVSTSSSLHKNQLIFLP